ncbi:hypothetical protein [Flavobacterium johnsoniae]|jgi:hypothetical protein|uniref:Uncharacterized protein n=1 Tax=Flavobacterium johnsoniae TaxID=986 RepID=A0A1J7BN18_FLAJO|nr:hypothetical protein [Flavobacterium johnsoniae]OIV40095.1 hypothetical protein BKM63_19260 [Flavobacterium johnsoniae]
MNVLIFATNIKTEKNKDKIATFLNANKSILQWTIDQEDIDCVLRIISEKLNAGQIIELLNFHDFDCKELQ